MLVSGTVVFLERCSCSCCKCLTLLHFTFLFIYLFIYLYLFIDLFIYLFSDSWIRRYVSETDIQGTMTSQFARNFQVPTSSVLLTRLSYKLSCNLTEIV